EGAGRGPVAVEDARAAGADGRGAAGRPAALRVRGHARGRGPGNLPPARPPAPLTPAEVAHVLHAGAAGLGRPDPRGRSLASRPQDAAAHLPAAVCASSGNAYGFSWRVRRGRGGARVTC